MLLARQSRVAVPGMLIVYMFKSVNCKVIVYMFKFINCNGVVPA